MAKISLAMLQSPLFREHHAPGPHPECPERLAAVEAGLAHALQQLPDVSLLQIGPRPATVAELGRVHSQDHIEQLLAIRGHSGHLDADTFYSAGSTAAAEAAAGGAIDMVDALLEGKAMLSIGLLRPPGHHATSDSAMGFCLFNNVAVAAAHAVNRGKERVFILDWDVHHGNGTQDIFYDDKQVLYFSTHQHPWYPGTGHAREVGTGAGLGFNVNVPLSQGAGDAEYFALWQHLLLPLLTAFNPDLVLISAGYDAHQRDPLGHMRVSSAGFGQLAQAVGQTVSSGSRCPIGLLLEGGYDLEALRGSMALTTLGLVAGLSGEPAVLEAPNQLVSAQFSMEIENALSTQAPFWRL